MNVAFSVAKKANATRCNSGERVQKLIRRPDFRSPSVDSSSVVDVRPEVGQDSIDNIENGDPEEKVKKCLDKKRYLGR